MVLIPQDVVVLLKLVSIGSANWTHNSLAVQLSRSASEIHADAANLLRNESERARPNISNLEEFLIHGLKYVFVPERGELSRGIPTGSAAPDGPREKFVRAGRPKVEKAEGPQAKEKARPARMAWITTTMALRTVLTGTVLGTGSANNKINYV